MTGRSRATLDCAPASSGSNAVNAARNGRQWIRLMLNDFTGEGTVRSFHAMRKLLKDKGKVEARKGQSARGPLNAKRVLRLMIFPRGGDGDEDEDEEKEKEEAERAGA